MASPRSLLTDALLGWDALARWVMTFLPCFIS